MQLAFENPGNLWFLLALPLLVASHFYFLRHAKTRALRFANFRALKRITGKSLVTKNYWLLLLRLFTILFMVLAASGTTLWYEGVSQENDFVIAIDTSASMTAQDVKPTRIEAAKTDALLFIDALRAETRIGVVTFAGVSLIQQVPTTDLVAAKEAIRGIEPIRAGGTDIPGAIITSTNLLLDNTKGRSVVLLTDGSSTIETFLDASMERAVAYAQEHRVTIHTIGIGSEAGPVGYLPEYYNVSSTYNKENLLLIANATHGIYAKAETDDELIDAFQAIADDSLRQLLRRELSRPFLLAALLLIFLEWVLANTRFRKIP